MENYCRKYRNFLTRRLCESEYPEPKISIIFNYISNDAKNENSVCSIYDYTNIENDETENICNR